MSFLNMWIVTWKMTFQVDKNSFLLDPFFCPAYCLAYRGFQYSGKKTTCGIPIMGKYSGFQFGMPEKHWLWLIMHFEILFPLTLCLLLFPKCHILAWSWLSLSMVPNTELPPFLSAILIYYFPVSYFFLFLDPLFLRISISS